MYEHISHTLSEARASGDAREIKKALLFMVESMEEKLEAPLSYETFAYFVPDEAMLFRTTKDVFSSTGPDTRVTTTGLVDQLLDMCGIIEHESIANQLGDAILDLHSKLSRGLTDAHEEKSALIDALETVRLAVSG